MELNKDNRLDSDVNDQGSSPLSNEKSPQATRGQKLDQQTIDNIISDIAEHIHSFNFEEFSECLKNQSNPELKEALLSSPKIKEAFGIALGSYVFNGPDSTTSRWASHSLDFLKKFGIEKEIFQSKEFLKTMSSHFPSSLFSGSVVTQDLILKAMEESGCGKEARSIFESDVACKYMAHSIAHAIQMQDCAGYLPSPKAVDMEMKLEFMEHWFDVEKVLTPENIALIRKEEEKYRKDKGNVAVFENYLKEHEGKNADSNLTNSDTKTGYIFYDNGLLQRIGNLSDAWKNNTWTSQRSEECFKIINAPDVDKQSGEFRMACIELSNYFKPVLELIEERKAVLTDDQLAMVLKGCARMW